MKDFANNIGMLKSKEDFINFIEMLLYDLKSNSKEWENITLESYLEAMASWIKDMDGYYQNNNLPIPKNVEWNVFANILIGAKMYE